jgi:hypothetical protein
VTRAMPAVAAAALLLVMIVLSRDFGATWDERALQRYGEEIWEYYRGERPVAKIETYNFLNNRIYGGLVEVVSVAVQRALDASVANLFVIRHAVNSLFGWAGVVLAFLMASRLFGRQAGWLAAALLLAMPHYVGHSMNNAKDLPFAVLMFAALYYIVTLKPKYPYLPWGHAAKLAAAIALAINVRSMGLVLLGYAGLGLLVALIAARERSLPRLAATGGRFAATALAAVVCGTIFWPWAQQQPLVRPFEAFFLASGFNWGNPSLFAGRNVPAAELPWYYLPTWLLISIPPVVLAGAALSLMRLRPASTRSRREPVEAQEYAGSRVRLAALWAFVLIPATMVIVRGLTLYDGIRHMFFIVPPIAVIAAAGWDLALASSMRGVAAIAGVLLAVGLAEPYVFQVRNHPNQIAYFSPAIGGPRGAFGRFDMDYWGNCVLQAVEWCAAEAERAETPIGVSGNAWEVVVVDVDRFKRLYFRLPYRDGYHFNIHLLKGTRQDVLDTARRGDVLHRVTTADGTPLCVVLPGPEYPRLAEEHRRRIEQSAGIRSAKR